MANTMKIEEAQKKIGKTVNNASEVIQDRVEKTYDEVIDKLKDERDWLETEIKHEYRNARRYVRANPERGLGIAAIAGLAVGIILGRALR
tara:strand:- start:27799 stop:28068 length:270 start_codon:yes stop_codon:yes gene_type:complete